MDMKEYIKKLKKDVLNICIKYEIPTNIKIEG